MSTSTSEAGFDALFDLSFTKFLTPSVIRIIYLLGIVLLGLAWLAIVSLKRSMARFPRASTRLRAFPFFLRPHWTRGSESLFVDANSMILKDGSPVLPVHA